MKIDIHTRNRYKMNTYILSLTYKLELIEQAHNCSFMLIIHLSLEVIYILKHSYKYVYHIFVYRCICKAEENSYDWATSVG